MTFLRIPLLAVAGASLALISCSPQGADSAAKADPSANATQSANSNDPIQSAMSAAPESVARDAAVIAPNPDGSMRTLREGKNGFTCTPDDAATPGPDPMCMDANGLKWAVAWMTKTTPPAGAVGLIYMLAGGTDASNTDPFATKPSEGNNWIETGPHVMVVGSKGLLADYPALPKPDTTAPYVMFAGTPYDHLMIPIK